MKNQKDCSDGALLGRDVSGPLRLLSRNGHSGRATWRRMRDLALTATGRGIRRDFFQSGRRSNTNGTIVMLYRAKRKRGGTSRDWGLRAESTDGHTLRATGRNNRALAEAGLRKRNGG